MNGFYMQYCVLVKEEVLVFEEIHAENASDIIFSLFRQGFVLAPVLIEANNAENARACYQHRYEWKDVSTAFQQKKVLVC
ncbi:hypothetical protein L6J37_05145 [Photobacterium sp. WH77]|uniref:Uncharacterized protein n=2 Tax=Photobacterium arenosum TaxID=2774143 RepID=A0ABR9BHL2_9GAMM|nr:MULTISPECIES: hypothetical protein [Photobacterium]MBD8511947.1 hypothetical protein [Photobacterium arenosum]MCG2836246.1 hypothetical protein [Photobacterium sp. WH77]MCG2843617.1 hypothetical protein [Photobacterium sp. WH80]MDO6581044.1 hypothetical protein [Photobacterium sp. 2_MG-2023]